MGRDQHIPYPPVQTCRQERCRGGNGPVHQNRQILLCCPQKSPCHSRNFITAQLGKHCQGVADIKLMDPQQSPANGGLLPYKPRITETGAAAHKMRQQRVQEAAILVFILKIRFHRFLVYSIPDISCPAFRNAALQQKS